MQSDVLLVLVGMAVVTYSTQVGGLWLITKVPSSSRVAAWLRHIPGAVLVALVAPTIFTQGLAEASAALTTVLVAIRTKNVLLAMVVGIGVVWGLRHFFP
jgi:uncharacterized membrane protein